ncbi:MAG: TetR/AcrR family transcriptional regulator [Alphaproteobacteria bacterium]
MNDQGPVNERPVTKRPRADERRKAIVAEAGALFAESGFEVSTREIATRCGITQAALYKHFQSKDDIVQEVFRTRFLERDRSAFAATLEAEGLPLEERIYRAYSDLYFRME